MKINSTYCLLYVLLGSIGFSCVKIPSQFAAKYYKKHETNLIQIEHLYTEANKNKPLIIDFADNAFNYVTLQIKTDSLRYVYEFSLFEKSIQDSLHKYGYDTTSTMKLIKQMKAIKCTWINTRDYYIDGVKQNLVFMAIRPTDVDLPFSNKKYYILTFYKQPQYYDAEGKLLDKRNRNRLRKLNDEIFYRINNKVCYTISDSFR